MVLEMVKHEIVFFDLALVTPKVDVEPVLVIFVDVAVIVFVSVVVEADDLSVDMENFLFIFSYLEKYFYFLYCFILF